MLTEYEPFVKAEYLAGLFDGEGCVNLAINPNGVTIELQITNNSQAILEASSEFLHSQNVMSAFQTVFTKWGNTRRLRCSGAEAKSMAELLLPHVITKRRHLEIVLEACLLRKHLQETGQKVKDHLQDFDVFRQELHSLAIKGPKTLKPISRFFTGVGK